MTLLLYTKTVIIYAIVVWNLCAAAPNKRCKSKNCSENLTALGRSCSSYFDCQFAPAGCKETAWFKCDGSKCLCELFGHLHDELGPMEVEQRSGKCSMSMGGPCGDSNGITVECQTGFACVNATCIKAPEPPQQQRGSKACRPEDGCEFGKERPPCHNPTGCEFGKVNPVAGSEEIENREQNQQTTINGRRQQRGQKQREEQTRSHSVRERDGPRRRDQQPVRRRGGHRSTVRDESAEGRRYKSSEFDQPQQKQSRRNAKDWGGGSEGTFRFYSYAKPDEKCNGENCGGGGEGADTETEQSAASCGSSGCGDPPPPPPPTQSSCGNSGCGQPKPSCNSGSCSKTPKRGCGGGGSGCGRKPASSPCSGGKGCGRPMRPPKPSCSSCGGNKPEPSGSGHCGEDGCGDPPPPPCDGGCPKPKPSCGEDECEGKESSSCGGGCGGSSNKHSASPSCAGNCPEEVTPPPHNPDAESSCHDTNSCDKNNEGDQNQPPCDKFFPKIFAFNLCTSGTTGRHR